MQGVRANRVGATVRCSTVRAPGVVIIGDAAHGVRPTMGQGCNSAMQSAFLLSEVGYPTAVKGPVWEKETSRR